MAELRLTTFGAQHHWVEGGSDCSYEGAGSPGGKFANIKTFSSCELQMIEL